MLPEEDRNKSIQEMFKIVEEAKQSLEEGTITLK
jgi:hypothetical protein